MHILIIDDDKVDSEQMSKILVEKEIHVECVATGTEALEVVKHNNFDAILVDYMLPDFDGLSLVSKIREESAAPIVFVTGKGSELIATKAIDAGAQNYFPKDNLKNEQELFYKIVCAPSNMQYLEVLAKLHLLRQQAKSIENRCAWAELTNDYFKTEK